MKNIAPIHGAVAPPSLRPPPTPSSSSACTSGVRFEGSFCVFMSCDKWWCHLQQRQQERGGVGAPIGQEHVRGNAPLVALICFAAGKRVRHLRPYQFIVRAMQRDTADNLGILLQKLNATLLQHLSSAHEGLTSGVQGCIGILEQTCRFHLSVASSAVRMDPDCSARRWTKKSPSWGRTPDA
jgi:hypothetical protein